MPGFRVPVSNNGVRTLLPGAPTNTVATDSFIYEAAQVEEIIVNEASNKYDQNRASATANVGRAKVRFVNTDQDTRSKNLVWADPLIPYQTSYPLVGEYVLVFKMLGTYWYIGPLNTKRKISENAHPVVGTILEAARTENAIDRQRQALRGVTTQASKIKTNAGDNFKELNVNPVKAFEGDIIYQGRYGQSIRLGSSQLSQASDGEQFPNIILRAGQSSVIRTADGPAGLTNESLNADASSIYMVSKQILPLVPATYGTNIHLRSTFEKPIFDGASILINSDKLIFNAKQTSIYMFSKKGIHLNTLDDGFTLDSAGNVTIRTPNLINLFAEKTISFDSKEDTIVNTKRDVLISADRNVTFHGNEIFLGGRSSNASPIAMAKPLKLFLFELLRTIMSTSPLTLGPSGVVNPALIARMLVVYAKYQVFPDPFQPLWASNDNFVMKTNERTLAGDLPANESLKNVTGLGSSGVSTIDFGREAATNSSIRNIRKFFDDETTSKL
jgi:hypothetical protein